MTSKPVFSEQAEQFTIVVDALLQSQETRAAFAKAPLATLEQYGIEFKDRTVAKKVEAELVAFAGSASAYYPDPDGSWPPRYYAPIPFAARATCITWVAKGDHEELLTIDRSRVDAFKIQATLQNKITMLEKKIAELEANMAKR